MRRNTSQVAIAAALLSSAAVVLFAPNAARADDFKLKDGTRISGTIVGFDENSFKVKTSYGYALVEKDQIVSISISTAASTPAPAPEKKPEPVVAKPVAPAKPKPEIVNAVPPASADASASSAAPPAKTVAAKPAPAPAAKPVVAKATPAPATPAPAAPAAPVAPAAATPAATAPATAAANAVPPTPAAPEPIREHVAGNVYTNDTYRFHMYKPPSWDVIEGARSLLPGAVAAMGTSDETTYLLIGQEPAGKTLASDIDSAERRLRDVMDHFRPLGEEHVTISGAAAVEHRFRGSVDQHDWSGIVAFVQRGQKLYTIFGMTRADSDLVQIQENVIARTISSLQFTEQ